jgi:hypothetical protein
MTWRFVGVGVQGQTAERGGQVGRGRIQEMPAQRSVRQSSATDGTERDDLEHRRQSRTVVTP